MESERGPGRLLRGAKGDRLSEDFELVFSVHGLTTWREINVPSFLDDFNFSSPMSQSRDARAKGSIADMTFWCERTQAHGSDFITLRTSYRSAAKLLRDPRSPFRTIVAGLFLRGIFDLGPDLVAVRPMSFEPEMTTSVIAAALDGSLAVGVVGIGTEVLWVRHGIGSRDPTILEDWRHDVLLGGTLYQYATNSYDPWFS